MIQIDRLGPLYCEVFCTDWQIKRFLIKIIIKLTLKHLLCVQGRARGSKCEFTEEQDGPHFRYTSAYNPAWVMGFNRKGSPVRGGDRRPNNLYKFIKQQLEDPDSPQTSRKTSSPHTSRHVRRRGQHNRRDVLKVNFNYAPNQVHMRHSKKSHRPRNRQTHFHSERDDRWVALKNKSVIINIFLLQ